MFGASLSEVWGPNYESKPKKDKKKKFKIKPLSPEEKDSELLIRDNERGFLKTERERINELKEDYPERYSVFNKNNVKRESSLGNNSKSRPTRIEDDPDYQEFLEFKNTKMNNFRQNNLDRQSEHENKQLNELILYVFTGFFLLILYDNIYRLGKNSY